MPTQAQPPNLRPMAKKERSCSSCYWFRVKPGESWKGEGSCSYYDSPVKADSVCDEFLPYSG